MVSRQLPNHCKPNKEDTMKKTSYAILDKIRNQIQCENFKKNSKYTSQYFIRNCLITFPVLILFILNLPRRSLQSELNNFVKVITLPSISKQAFSAARKKLLPAAFVNLNRSLVHEFYTDNEFQKFQAYRLIVVDGSTLQLPESNSIRDKYGECSNQKSCVGMTMSRISHAYDPLNGITLDAIMKPYKASERQMALEHILNIQHSNTANDLYLFDRGYPSILLIYFLIFHGKNFVMRCSTGWLSAVNRVLKSGKRDEIIEINPRMLSGKKREEFKNQFPGVCLKKSIKIRVLVIRLPTGEDEVLITSLLDKVEFTYGMFKGVYNLRWGGEENYKFHKVRIELENFSGKTPHAIEQDFHASVLASNIRALIAEEAQTELEQIYPKKEMKYVYKINKNISIGILKDKIADIFFNPDGDLKEFCERLKFEMKKNVVPIRPGRRYTRIRKGNKKYPMNRRRAL